MTAGFAAWFENVMGVAPWVVIACVGGWFAQVFFARQRSSDSRAAQQEKSQSDVQINRDKLITEMLVTARAEIALLREETAKLRPLEAHLYHLQQALEHIESLLTCDAENRGGAERNAKAFLNRMRRLSEAAGTVANEAQRIDSAVAIAERMASNKEQ